MEGRRTVTLDPLAPAPAVEHPQIGTVLSTRSGRLLDATRYITGRRYEDLVRTRGRLLEAVREGRPRLLCSLCHTPVHLVASRRKAFFFRHRHEDGSCPALTRGALGEAEIRARQYAGLRESDAHRRLKRLVARSLEADPAFGDVVEERTWRAGKSNDYRRPDVSCRLGDLRLAFEAQLSTTFLAVVVERRIFYRREGALLVWVLARFDPNDRRMTEDDILFWNNSNVLVVDEMTARASEAAGRFLVRCWFRRPGSTNGATRWASDVVPFGSLTLDLGGQRAFLVDVEGEERKALREEEAERAHQAQAEDAALRDAFLVFWARRYDRGCSYDEQCERWVGMQVAFASRGIDLPPTWYDEELARRLAIVLSAKAGAPREWRFKRLPEIAHHLHARRPDLLFLFGRLLRHYGHSDLLKSEDRTGSWARKAEYLRKDTNRDRYAPTYVWSALLAFLFPDVAGHLRDEGTVEKPLPQRPARVAGGP